MVARVDQATDPAVVADLATVRLGTAFFRRALNRVRDEELGGPSALPDWDRNHVIAHVGYNARALARLVDWAATGIETPMYESTQARNDEIEFGATLNSEALRNLVEHSAIDLDVRWRDLPDDCWSHEVRTAQGRAVPASETVWMRSREVWLHAVDLASGARFEQIPTEVLTRLIGDVHRTWSSRPDVAVPTLVATDADVSWGDGGDRVAGPTAILAAWATGRLPIDRWARDLDFGGGEARPAPRWI